MVIVLGHIIFIDYSSRSSGLFISTKTFAAFRKYKAWAENLLRDDKGGEYRGANLDDSLAEAGIRHERSIRRYNWVLRSM